MRKPKRVPVPVRTTFSVSPAFVFLMKAFYGEFWVLKGYGY